MGEEVSKLGQYGSTKYMPDSQPHRLHKVWSINWEQIAGEKGKGVGEGGGLWSIIQNNKFKFPPTKPPPFFGNFKNGHDQTYPNCEQLKRMTQGQQEEDCQKEYRNSLAMQPVLQVIF